MTLLTLLVPVIMALIGSVIYLIYIIGKVAINNLPIRELKKMEIFFIATSILVMFYGLNFVLEMFSFFND